MLGNRVERGVASAETCGDDGRVGHMFREVVFDLLSAMSVAVAGSDGGRARLKSADQTPSYYRTRAPPRSDPLILPHLRGKVDKS